MFSELTTHQLAVFITDTRNPKQALAACEEFISREDSTDSMWDLARMGKNRAIIMRAQMEFLQRENITVDQLSRLANRALAESIAYDATLMLTSREALAGLVGVASDCNFDAVSMCALNSLIRFRAYTQVCYVETWSKHPRVKRHANKALFEKDGW